MKKENKRYYNGQTVDITNPEVESEKEKILEEITEEPSAEEKTNGPETKNGIIVNASLVNVRKLPSFESEKLEVLKKGDAVTIIEKEGEFYKVSTNNNRIAYIASDFIEEE